MKSLRALAIPIFLAVAACFAAPSVASAGGFHGGHFHGGSGHFHGGFHSHAVVGFGFASPFYYAPSVVVAAPYPAYADPYSYPYPAPYAYGYSPYAGYPYAAYPYGYAYSYGAPAAYFSVHAHGVPVPHFHGGGHGHGGFHGHVAVHRH